MHLLHCGIYLEICHRLPLPSGEFLTLHNSPLHNDFVEMFADFPSVNKVTTGTGAILKPN